MHPSHENLGPVTIIFAPGTFAAALPFGARAHANCHFSVGVARRPLNTSLTSCRSGWTAGHLDAGAPDPQR